MKVKALVFDLDGTAIPNDRHGMPSQRIIDAVRKAKEVCHVSIATGRPYSVCKEILDALKIEDICILNGGTHLYSRKTDEYIWKQEIDLSTLQQLFFKLKSFKQYMVADEKKMSRVAMEQYSTNEPVGLSCIFATSKEDSLKILRIVKGFPGITAHAMSSWTAGAYDIHITHELATKKHALQSLLAHLNVNHENTMVVGDGGNDLPLFELAGLKVAMGNGTEELKKAADWIAPSVKEDGLAVAIEKYIIS